MHWLPTFFLNTFSLCLMDRYLSKSYFVTSMSQLLTEMNVREQALGWTTHITTSQAVLNRKSCYCQYQSWHLIVSYLHVCVCIRVYMRACVHVSVFTRVYARMCVCASALKFIDKKYLLLYFLVNVFSLDIKKCKILKRWDIT